MPTNPRVRSVAARCSVRGAKGRDAVAGDDRMMTEAGELSINKQTRAAEYPEWDISFIGGSRPHWRACRVFDSPSALVIIECLSAQALRSRLYGNSLTVTPGMPWACS